MSYRTALFVDKITLTQSIPRPLQNEVLTEAASLALDGELTLKSRNSPTLAGPYRYAYARQLTQMGELLIQLAPWDDYRDDTRPRRSFMRLEWNPSKSPNATETATQVQSILNRIVPHLEFSSIIDTANLTRIDLAFDVLGTKLDQLCVYSLLRRNYSDRYKYSPYGNLIFQGLGKPNGDRYLRIYDKTEEARSSRIGGFRRSTTSIPPVKRVRRTHARVRFELQVRDLGQWDRLVGLSNPFENYIVRQLRSAAFSQSKNHELFWLADSIFRRGGQAALSLIEDRRTRARYANLIQEMEPPLWWDPEALWEEVPAAIARVFLQS